MVDGHNGSVRGVLFGGNANNGANAGFVNSNSNNAPSNTNANIGSRLSFTQKYLYTKSRVHQPYLLVKNKSVIKVVGRVKPNDYLM